MIEQVAVEKPVAGLVRHKLDDGGGHRFDINRVLERRAIALAVDHAEKMAVQMHRVVHHGAVDHDEPNHLSLADEDVVLGADRLVVDHPYIAVHIAIEGETELPARGGFRKRGVFHSTELRIGCEGPVVRHHGIGGEPRVLRGVLSQEKVIPGGRVVLHAHVLVHFRHRRHVLHVHFHLRMIHLRLLHCRAIHLGLLHFRVIHRGLLHLALIHFRVIHGGHLHPRVIHALHGHRHFHASAVGHAAHITVRHTAHFHFHIHPRLVEFPGIHIPVRHSHGACGSRGEGVLPVEAHHRVVHKGLREIRRRTALAGADP